MVSTRPLYRAGLCGVRAQSHFGVGAGLIACRSHPRRCPSAVWRRSSSCNCARRHDGSRLGNRVHPCRCGSAGFHTRASFQADPLWLHERNRADGADQPTAQAFRLLDRRRWTLERTMGRRRSDSERKSKLDSVRGWRRHIGRNPLTQELLSCAWNTDCRCRRLQSLVH